MSALTLWGPARRHDPLSACFPYAEFDALVRRSFGTSTFGTSTGAGFAPRADVVRNGDDAVVRLELPGIDLENDVTVEVRGHGLTVRGERRDEFAEADRQGAGPYREVRYGSFRRTFRLPRHVDADAVSASYDAGVLTVRVAGAHAESEPTRIAVSGPQEAPEA